jgi:beta-glucosidase
MAFTGGGYFMGVHAPGRSGLRNFLPSIHHAAICQAEGGRIIRDLAPGALVGTTFSCSLVQPGSDSLKDHLAAQRVDALLNRVFVEPLAGKGYPVADLKFLRRLEPYIKNGDESKLNFNMDFIGIQNYNREIIKHSCFNLLIWARVISAKRRTANITAMNWEVFPESLYHMLVQFSKYSCFKEIIVTESGAAFDDQVIDGRVHDEKRKIYHENYISQVLRAREQGVNVKGYFAWSFSDNFEWAEGFRPRFGLVYIDFETQQRIVKDSGLWYSHFLSDKQLSGKVNFDL